MKVNKILDCTCGVRRNLNKFILNMRLKHTNYFKSYFVKTLKRQGGGLNLYQPMFLTKKKKKRLTVCAVLCLYLICLTALVSVFNVLFTFYNKNLLLLLL